MTQRVQIVQHGQTSQMIPELVEMRVTDDGRRYLNYDGTRFNFVLRGCRARYGVAKHSKYQAKLTLIVDDPEVVRQLESISDRIQAQFEPAAGQNIFKSFLAGDRKMKARTIALKIKEDSTLAGGGNIMGGIQPDDVCDAVFSTVAYRYGAYYGFSHTLKVVKVTAGASTSLEHVL